MKISIALGLASALALAAVSPAQARQGCGVGFHRTPNGRCVSNMRRQVWVVGRYYPGRGYWYNGRWWHHRQRIRNEWRYR